MKQQKITITTFFVVSGTLANQGHEEAFMRSNVN